MNSMINGFYNFIGFIIICASIYCAVLTFFSFISGWMRLSGLHPAPVIGEQEVVEYRSQTVLMGYMTYTMMVDTKFTDSGIILTITPAFFFMHKPMIIPYDRIKEAKKMDLYPYGIEFKFEKVKMQMEGESSAELEKILKIRKDYSD